MSTKQLAIFGAGGHAKVVAEIARLTGYEVVGFIDNVDHSRKGENFYGSVILGGESVLAELLQAGVSNIIVGFGNNRARLETAQMLAERGFTLFTAVHPNAVCAADVRIGPGTVIASGAVIGPSSRLGSNVIVNTQASLDHDCLVRDGAHLGPGTVVTGSVDIGECAWIGAGAVISDHKRIGADSIVGAGAVVVKDVPPNVVVMGVPARISRSAD